MKGQCILIISGETFYITTGGGSKKGERIKIERIKGGERGQGRKKQEQAREGECVSMVVYFH